MIHIPKQTARPEDVLMTNAAAKPKPARKKKETLEEKKERARQIVKLLYREYPKAECALQHTNPLELLISTILSAQCTDERVNMVTAELFRKYHEPEDFRDAPPWKLEDDIRSTGFYNNKAKNIRGACAKIIESFEGKVPETMDDLLTLPGVARKTANVVLGTAFGIASGIVVDTHVDRLSHLLGLTEQNHPEKIEKDLLELIPKKDWIQFSHMLIWHGRRICKARKPACAHCVLNRVCPSSKA